MSERYQYVRSIGHGHYGRVDQMKDQQGQMVAVKISESLEDNEIDILTRFRHPHLAHAIEFFLDDIQQAHIVMPLAQGTIYQYVRRHNPDFDTRVKWCHQIASAIHFLHKHQYYHCDIKSANILIQDGNAIVADFGLSYPIEMIQEFGGTPTLTAPEGLIWSTRQKLIDLDPTKSYIYEQKLNHKACDVYGLGVLFIFILTGEHLFGSLNIDSKEPEEQVNAKVINAYNRVIGNEEVLIELMTLDDDWKLLTLAMIDPYANKRHTIDQIVEHHVFCKMGSPIDGYIRTVPIETKTDIVCLFPWLWSTFYELHYEMTIAEIYNAFDLFHRLYSIVSINDVSIQTKQFTMACCFHLSNRLVGLRSDNDVRIWAKSSSVMRSQILELVNHIPSLVDGFVRNRTLYDLSVSEDESLFGLFLLFHSTCTLSPDEAHEVFLQHETPTQKENRQPKNGKIIPLGIFTIQQLNTIRFDVCCQL